MNVPRVRKPDGLPAGRTTWRRFKEKGWLTHDQVALAIRSGAVKHVRGVGRKRLKALREWAGLPPEPRRSQSIWPSRDQDRCVQCRAPAAAAFIRGPLCWACWRENGRVE